MKTAKTQMTPDMEAEMAFERHLSRMKESEIDFIPLFASPQNPNTEFYQTLMPNHRQRQTKPPVTTSSIFAPIIRIFNWSR